MRDSSVGEKRSLVPEEKWNVPEGPSQCLQTGDLGGRGPMLHLFFNDLRTRFYEKSAQMTAKCWFKVLTKGGYEVVAAELCDARVGLEAKRGA